MKISLTILFTLVVEVCLDCGSSRQCGSSRLPRTVFTTTNSGHSHWKEAEVVQPVCKPGLGDSYKCSFKAYGRSISLNLKRSSESGPKAQILGAKFDEFDHPFIEKLPDDEPAVRTFYEDLENMAAVFFHSFDDLEAPALEGFIGDMYIRPKKRTYPAKKEELAVNDLGHVFSAGSEQKSSAQPETQTTAGQHFLKFRDHVVVRRSPVKLRSDYSDTDGRSASATLIRKKSTPLTNVYVRVLVMVDHILYRAWGESKSAVRNYVKLFMKGVNLYFKDASHPNISIITSAIFIEDVEGALGFIAKNRIKHTDNFINIDDTLHSMSKYVYNLRFGSHRKTSPFNVVILLTGFGLCDTDCSVDIIGTAFASGVCSGQHSSRKDRGVGIVYDDGNYGGVPTAAHEIGHLLGAHHDSESHYFDRNGRKVRCSDDKNYLMAAKTGKIKNSLFSTCSLYQMRKFLNGDDAGCLHRHYHAPN